MTLYLNAHSSQYAPDASTITHRAGCTWTSVANGVDASTGGRLRPTPDQVHAMVPNAEETSPTTPGWSIPDAVKAARRLGVELVDRSGDGWGAALLQLEAGHYLLLQGDSDVFTGGCSGEFDGPHAIGIHPRHKDEDGERWWWINDPICQTGRWERESVLRAYAEKLSAGIRFASFTLLVPAVAAPKPPAKPVVLRHGARKLAKPVAKRIHVARGRKANVRTAPRTTARVVAHRARGEKFTAWQVTTDKGQRLAGSARWYGNRTGTRWIHSSSF